MAREFEAIAERTRLRVQKVIADTAGEAGDLSEAEVAALLWAQLGGAITAVGNGFAGLVARRQPRGTTTAEMKRALHDQFDAAIVQATLMKATAND